VTEVPKPEPKAVYHWSHRVRHGARVPKCVCGAPTALSDTHAAYYCSRSGEWLDATCGDRSCQQCVDRPERAPTSTVM